MKKTRKAIRVIMLLLAIFTLSMNAQAAVKISKKNAAIVKGMTTSLRIKGTKSKVSWRSSNPRIASVNANGVVRGLAKGTSTITGTVGKRSYNCKVTVEDPQMNRRAVNLEIKKSLKLAVTGTKQKIKWTSSNKKVATVTSKGVVKGKNGGKAIVSAVVGGKKLSCTVTVILPKINVTSATVEVGKTVQLRITGSSQKVTWKSGNKKIATVSNKGFVKAVKPGTATITASVAGKKLSCKITVKKSAPLSEKQLALRAYANMLSKPTIEIMPRGTKYYTYYFDGGYISYTSTKSSRLSFAIAYIDKNDIPELFVKENTGLYQPYVYALYTWKNGTIVRLCYGGGYAGIDGYYEKENIVVEYGASEGSYCDTYYSSIQGNRLVTVLQSGTWGDEEWDDYDSSGDEYYYYQNSKAISITKRYFNSLLLKKTNGKKMREFTLRTNSAGNRGKYIL